MNNAMTDISDIERATMRRVRRVRILRMAFSGATASCILLVLALWGIGREVWVAKVFSNGPQGLLGRTGYLAYAFVHTRVAVQALSLLTLASLLVLARSFARLVASAFFTPRVV